MIFSFAALLVLYSGKSEVAFTANDTAEFVDFIQSTFNTNDIKGWVEGIVKNKNIWKEDFAAIPFFIEEVTSDVSLILAKGMKEALNTLV